VSNAMVPAGGAAAAAAAALAQLEQTPGSRVIVPRPIAGTVPGQQPTMAPWGTPIKERVPNEGAPNNPDRSSSWGRQATLKPDGTKTGVIRVDLECSETLTLSIDVERPAPQSEPDLITMYVWAQVTFGNGSTSAQRNIRCDYRIDTPLVVSYLDVLLYLGDIDGTPINPVLAAGFTNLSDVFAQVEAQAARGVRGLPYNATQFITGQPGINSAATGAPAFGTAARLMSIAAHLTAQTAGDHFLQLFDTTNANAPSNGATPIAEFALGSTPTGSAIPTSEIGRFLAPRGFANGIYWAVSDTSGVLSQSAETAWVELEIQLI
jgi:hypothetical protein